jgi:hypothetical protein
VKQSALYYFDFDSFSVLTHCTVFLVHFNSVAKGPLQEFDVTTDMFGTLVPKMQSVSLAIDSNWGLEYSCLYRFRVHGDEIDHDHDVQSKKLDSGTHFLI